MPNNLTEPDMESVILAAIYKARWVDNFGKEPTIATDAAIATAVLDALKEVTNVEWGVAWNGLTMEPMQAVSRTAAINTAELISGISSDGDPAYAISRVAFPWSRVQ